MPYVQSKDTTFKGGGQALSFKCGSQEALEPYIQGTKSAQDGTFYLTNDTSRLYVGNNGKAVPVNQGVITVDNISRLPSPGEAGQFYYAEFENVLAVWSGKYDGSGTWVQINNNTDTTLESLTKTVSGVTGGVTVETSVKTTDVTKDPFKDSIEIIGSNGVKVSSTDDDTISIEGTAATLSSSGAVVSLGGAPHSGSVTFEGDNNLVTVAGNGANKIKISVDDSAHVTSEEFSNEATGFKHTTKFKSGQSVDATVDPIISYVGGSVHFVNGTATLDVYSTGEVDSLLEGVNAMHYKGTVSGASGATLDSNRITVASVATLETASGTKYKIGDTYAASTNIEIGESVIKAGSLFIATGTKEDADGYISEGLKFNVINESFEADTKYTLTTESVSGGGKATLTASTGGSQSFDVVGSGDVIGSYDTDNQQIVLKHKDDYTAIDVNGAGAAATLDVNAPIKVITGIEVNSKGHTEKVETTEISIGDFDTVFVEDESSIATSVVNNEAKVTHKSTISTSNRKSESSHDLILTSETLKYATDGNAGVKIDMVWGSFDPQP